VVLQYNLPVEGDVMHIQILGTGAAEAWPALFCGCSTCRRAREAGGKDLRSRSSVQINGIYKIDLPPDTYHHLVANKLDLSRLSHLFITHSHMDHLDIPTIEMMGPVFAHNLEKGHINILGSSAVAEKINAAYGGMELPIKVSAVKPFVPVRAGELTFTPVLASHMPDEECLNYVVSSGESTMLYASDTGIYPDVTVEYLCGLKFNLLVIECTCGTLDIPPTGHMTFEAVLGLVNRLKSAGAASSGTRIVITHFSHNIGMLHAELESLANPHGIEVAYDGMVIDI
jgi:phosphoribosyl 1,2-cyclic phosphate phosphodiesterase